MDGERSNPIPPNQGGETLRRAAKAGNCNLLEEVLSRKSTNPNAYPPNFDETALHLAVEANSVRAVQILLKHGADPTLTNRYGETALHIAARNGNVRIVHLLLANQSNAKEFVNAKNEAAKTALQVAIDNKQEEVVAVLSSSGAVIPAERNPRKSLDFLPLSTLQKTLDLCITRKNSETGEEDDLPTVVLSFSLLTNFFGMDNNEEWKLMEYLMNSSRHKKLLLHPLIASFLYMKWRCIYYLMFINLFIYGAFEAFWTAYVCVRVSRINVTKEILEGNYILEYKWSSLTNSLLAASLVFLIALIFAKVIKICVAWRLHIFTVDFVLEICVVIFVLLSLSFRDMLYQQHFAVYATLLGWTNFAILLRGIPAMAKYVTMFYRVLKQYFRFFCVFSFLILGFAISFYITHHFCTKENLQCYSLYQYWSDFAYTLWQTLIMIAGDFQDSPSKSINDFPPTSQIIFLAFMFFMVIVLMNLLNALAVNDTRRVAKDAELFYLTALVRSVCYVERTVVKCCDFCCGKLCWPFPSVAQKFHRHVMLLESLEEKEATVDLRYGTVECVMQYKIGADTVTKTRKFTLPEQVTRGLVDLVTKKPNAFQKQLEELLDEVKALKAELQTRDIDVTL